MTRLTSYFAKLEQHKRKALIPYIVAGDPDPDITVPMLHALVDAGSDIIELGVPFSDPMAEGPVIQAAHERSLAHHVSLHDVLAMVATFRQRNQQTPIVLMGYANPVVHMGYQVFAKLAASAGIDGLLTVDMPPEEAGGLSAALQTVGIDSIFLIAPTTTKQRIERIACGATGYLYYVSLKGVTGAGHLDLDSVKHKLGEIKAVTDLPITVGFGIKDAKTAKAIAELAEGVVVGSALVKRMADLADKTHDEQIAQSVELIAGMRRAMDTL